MATFFIIHAVWKSFSSPTFAGTLLKNLFNLLGSLSILYNHSRFNFLNIFGDLFFVPLRTSKLPPTPTKIPLLKVFKLL